MTNQQFSEPTRSPGSGEDQDGLFDTERSTAYPPESLITLRFLRAATAARRLWILVALVGLAGGLASNYVLPSANDAAARILLTPRDGDDPAKAMATDVSLATTHSVANRAINPLNLARRRTSC